jgi:hypothetical protein
MQDDNSNDKPGQTEENPDENIQENQTGNDKSDAAEGEGIKDNETKDDISEEIPESGKEDMPLEDKTTTIDIKKDKHIGEEEKKSNKKIFLIAGIAIILAILLIAILLLFLFCKNNDIPDNSSATTVTAEQTSESSSNNDSSSSSSSSESSPDVPEETPEPTEEITAIEVIEETPETEPATESVATKPTISLAIIEGPIYSPADDVCFYRVRATVTGNPGPNVSWSKNDTSSYGDYVAQVNLTRANPTYTLTGTATNSAGSASDSIPLSWGCNGPPDVTAINIASEVAPGSSNLATAVATDPDGDVLAYSWTVNGGSLSNAAINPTNWTAPQTPGSYRITVTVNDGKGGTDSMFKNVTVVEQNRPPEVSDIIVRDRNTQTTVNYAVTSSLYDLSVNVNDPDGDALTFSWSLSGSINPGSLSNSNSNPASWTAPYYATWVTITVVVDDGNGGVVTRNREVEVRYGVY